jgi:CRP-like cAMP-binding protein
LSFNSIENIIKSGDNIIKNFEKKEPILFRTEPVDDLMVLIFGEVVTEMSDFNGKVMQVERIKSPSLLAPGFVFASKNISPVDIISDEKTTILYISKSQILKYCNENQDFLKSLLEVISKKVIFLSQKLYFNSMKSIKEKIIFYLMQLYNQQGKTYEIILPVSIEEMSHIFGVARPSLSREFLKLEECGIIKKEGNKILLLNKNELYF